MTTEILSCLVCGVNIDQKTSEFCCGDINGNLLTPIVKPDWKHIWTDGKEAGGWKWDERLRR